MHVIYPCSITILRARRSIRLLWSFHQKSKLFFPSIICSSFYHYIHEYLISLSEKTLLTKHSLKLTMSHSSCHIFFVTILFSFPQRPFSSSREWASANISDDCTQQRFIVLNMNKNKIHGCLTGFNPNFS